MTIRRARPEDAARLAGLSGELGYPVEEVAMAQRVSRLASRADHLVLVAETPAGHVIGWLHACEHESLQSGGRCEILGLVVDPRHRGGGIGRALAEAARSWAAGRGIHELGVRCNVSRQGTHAFYERLGFVRVKTQHCYRESRRGSGLRAPDDGRSHL